MKRVRASCLLALCTGCAIGDPFEDLPPDPSGPDDGTGTTNDDETGNTTFTTSTSSSTSTSTSTSTTTADDTGGFDHQPICDQASCICQGLDPSSCDPEGVPCDPNDYCIAQCIVESGTCDPDCSAGFWTWTAIDDQCVQSPTDPTDPTDPTGNSTASGGSRCTDLSYCLNINVITNVTNPPPCPNVEVGIGANNECDQSIYCGIIGWQPDNTNPQGYYALELGPFHDEPSILLWCSDTSNQVGSTYRCSAPGEPSECWEPF
jgi:hypothetical protein